MFRLENLSTVNYFAKIYIARFNKHQRNVYYIGLSYARETKINPSSQFEYKKTRNCKELKKLLKEKGYKMKSILLINIQLLMITLKKKEISNDVVFSTNVILTLTSKSTYRYKKGKDKRDRWKIASLKRILVIVFLIII